MYNNYSAMRNESGLDAAAESLSSLSTEQLKDLLNNEEKLEAYVDTVTKVKNLGSEKELKIASNKSTAEFNLSREPQLVEGRQRLFDLNTQAENLARSVEEKINSLKNNSNTLSLETSLALLQTSAAESEEQSDQIAEKFLDGETDLDSFIDQFADLRKLMHLRRIKSDKMADLIKSVPTPVASYFAPPAMGMGSAPYPSSINMPMPALRYGPSY